MPTSITRDQLRSALADGSVTVVDALPPAAFGARHLPDAINLVTEDDDARLNEVLPDKAATIVAYSTDADCGRGPALAERLQVVPPDTPHGFRNIGDVPLLVVSAHERGTVRQTWLGAEPA